MNLDINATTIVVGMITGLLGSTIPAIISARSNAKRLKGERSNILSEASGKIAEATEQQIANLLKSLTRLEKELDEACVKIDRLEKDLAFQRGLSARLEREVDNLRRGAIILVRQLRKAGIEPEWTPPSSS